MADNKFFYNTNYKGIPQKDIADLTGTVVSTVSGSADNIITFDITLSDSRADGLTLFWSLGGVTNSDLIGNANGTATITGTTASVVAELDSENATATGINISGRINSNVGKVIFASGIVNILQIDGPQIPGTLSADGEANITVFSANGSLSITSLTPYSDFNRVRALVVGGGGATGHQLNANIANVFNAGVTSVGGGGGGEVINDLVYLNSTSSLPVTVGVGGSFDSYANSDGRDSSIVSSLTTLTANGGGGGGCARPIVGNGEGTPNNPNTTISGNVIQQLGFQSNTIDGRDGGSGGGAACEASDISRFSSWSNNLSSNFKGKPGNATVSASGLGSQGGQGAGHGRAGLGGLNVETFNQVYADGPYSKIAFSSGGIWPPAPTTFTDGGPGVGNFNAGRPLGGGGGGGASATGGKGNANAIINVFNGYSSAKTGGDGGDGVSYTIFNTAGNTVYYGGGGGGGPTFLDLLGFDFNSYLAGSSLMTGGHLNFNTQGPGNNSYLARPGDPGQGGSSANIGGGGSVQFIANKGGKELHEQTGGTGTVIVRSKLKYRVFQT